MLEQIILLAILLQFKHYLADYILQFPYMYENKGKPKGWFGPLFEHAGVHGFFMGVILIYFNPVWAVPLAIFDLITHMIIDRWKATKKGGPDTSKFWHYLGADQMFHHLVGIIIIYATFALV